MFYSQDILQKRGGKFGIIWIAATRASDLTKRDYSAVNVARTCEEIISHLTGQSRARYDRGRFPRFSLYLSAQLMFGVTLVHGKHAEYLYGDAMTLQSKFIPKRRVAPGGLIIISTKDIDMRTSTRPTEALRLEDPLDMYRPGLVELDPEFGRLNIPEDMIEPDFLPFGPEMIHFPLAPPTPDWWPGRGRDTRKPRSPHSPGSPPGYDPNQVKDKNDISLPEHDWPSLDQMPGKDDDDLQPPQMGDPLMSSLSSPENGDKEGPTQPPMEQPSRKRPDREKSDKPPKRKKPSDPREPEAEQDLPRDVEPLPMYVHIRTSNIAFIF
ncbi:PREDICTED: meiotic recombination protein REC8 homolog [Branchiostoma belcheri]|uniref:Meiotic recombination protein REC8 homolog n=1 Tax=Branchiostoma belcheri TaxID=7741 RepID=A0A6P5AMT0_BRABE|nr:PREDICTED: meiotic recombination protein REC8 homolog [Branchiostoma belcheri]